jgi:diaminobutyrate-2-oxoglutarate transaminase
LHRGLILELGGRQDCVVRLMPPLNVTEDVIDTACTIVRDVFQECGPATPPAPGSLLSMN